MADPAQLLAPAHLLAVLVTEDKARGGMAPYVQDAHDAGGSAWLGVQTVGDAQSLRRQSHEGRLCCKRAELCTALVHIGGGGGVRPWSLVHV